MKSIIVWRLFWLSRTFSLNKEKSCDYVLSKQEYQLLYKRFNQGKSPTVEPSTEEVYYWIAKLGGYIGRKSDPPPGMISIWRGWNHFMMMINDFEAICG